MTTANFNNSSFAIHTYDELFHYFETVGSGANSFTWRSENDFLVKLVGRDFVFDVETGLPVAGTVTSIQIRSWETAGSDPADLVLKDLPDLSVSDFDFTESDGRDATEAFWLMVMAGGSTINLDGEYHDFGASGAQVRDQTYFGDDNTITGAVTGGAHIYGGVEEVINATYISGNTTIDIFAEHTYGDFYGGDGAMIVGGDDMIIITTPAGSDYNNDIDIYGDGYRISHGSSAFGGNDTITAKNVMLEEDDEDDYEVYIYGDIGKVSSDDVMTLVGGDDHITGSKTAMNSIVGDLNVIDGGPDTLRFVGGADTIYGGDNNDTIYGDSNENEVSPYFLSYAGGNDIIYTKKGDDEVYGGGGKDKIYLGKGSSEVEAGSGNDYIRIDGLGVHTIDGGEGTDKLSFSQSDNGVTVDLDAGTADGGLGRNVTFDSIENVSGSQTGGDLIYGDEGRNNIQTYGGNDIVSGFGGGDKVNLGNGNDLVYAGSGQNTYYGEGGTDTLVYVNSESSVEVDIKSGDVSGGYANGDTIGGFENLRGSGFNDELKGTNGKNVIYGNDGGDQIVGRDGDDKLYGGSGSDNLVGGKDSDKLYGGNGTDFLVGSKGNDQMTGGGGADVFHFNKGDDKDVIRDFQNNTDTIEIDGYANNYDAFDHATQVGDDVVFNFGSGDTLTVRDVTIGQLTNDLDIV